MFFVRAAQYAKNMSGADMCEYSSRKWCSTDQQLSNPSWSASSTVSTASWKMRDSLILSHGFVTTKPTESPNFMRDLRPPPRAVRILPRPRDAGQVRGWRIDRRRRPRGASPFESRREERAR